MPAPSIANATPVPSPCVNVCRMEAGLCAGCWRTLDEIAAWSRLDDAGKRAVWAQLEERRLQHLPLTTPRLGER